MIKLKSKEVDFQTFLLACTFLKKSKEMEIAVSGISMLPLYAKDIQITTVRHIEDLKSLKRFDIIIFWQNNILISHYYWKRNEHFNDDPNDPNIVTRPLNPIRSFDHPIKSAQILGILPEKINLWLKIKILFCNYF
ncbi:MAG: hypothetical protein K2Q18_02090 [Bdellovibrionales bacterium]|nr:hypothetical protein [Bdellovibrionales bacterium]